jgi:hypothetical protein
MNLQSILSKTAIFAVLVLYFCLRTQSQCHASTSTPHSHFITIKQKTVNIATQNLTIPDVQPILLALFTHTDLTYSEPAHLNVIITHHVSSRASHCSGCFGERSPPAC